MQSLNPWTWLLDMPREVISILFQMKCKQIYKVQIIEKIEIKIN
jgi:hypothetical protein